MACPAFLACHVGTVSGCQTKMSLEVQTLVVGTKQSLSNLLFLDIYGYEPSLHHQMDFECCVMTIEILLKNRLINGMYYLPCLSS